MLDLFGFDFIKHNDVDTLLLFGPHSSTHIGTMQIHQNDELQPIIKLNATSSAIINATDNINEEEIHELLKKNLIKLIQKSARNTKWSLHIVKIKTEIHELIMNHMKI